MLRADAGCTTVQQLWRVGTDQKGAASGKEKVALL